MQKIIISICIVSYKDEKKLDKALHSIYKYPPKAPYEIVLVDNNENSSNIQKLVKKYSKIKYIKARFNGGYGAGNNLAIANSGGEFVLIMNPDVIVSKDTINSLLDFLKSNKTAGGVGLSYQETGKRLVPLGTGDLTPMRAVFTLGILNKIFPNNYFSSKYYLTDSDRKKIRKVGAIAGSFGMFRRDAFLDVGMFDEKIFLYFEESDLGIRLQKKGWDLWILPGIKLKHEIAGSTQKVNQDKLGEIFRKSRYYYFKKHFGIFPALLVELFSRFGKSEAIILLITVIGLFLRIYRVSENVVFHGELGDNYLAIKNILNTGILPLFGPPTSHSWLSFGPLFYWIFTPILLLLRFEPAGMSILFAILLGLLVPINYFFIKRLLDKRIAIISSFFISISPGLIYFTRESRFFSLILIFFYPFVYFLLKNRLFWSGVFLGIMLNFHLSPLLFIPAVFVYFLKNKNLKDNIKKFTLGLLIPSLPFILGSISSDKNTLIEAAVWVPYRVAGFLGFIPKNNLNEAVFFKNAESINTFINSVFLQDWKVYLAIIMFLIFGLLAYRKKINRVIGLMIVFLLVGLGGIFIHGDAPIHYYLPLYIPMIILMSFILLHINKYTFVFIFVFVTIVNSQYFFSDKWFYLDQTHFSSDKPVPYNIQVELTKKIVQDAEGYPFSLKRVGPFDYFDYQYSQNYRYLLWKMGNEPKPDQLVTYTIYEGINPSAKNETIIFNKGGITVTK